MIYDLDLFRRYAEPERIVVAARRGLTARHPENTMPACRAAAHLGVDLLEVDLRATREGLPILLHDATLDRTTNGTGSPNDYTLAELRCFNASHWRGTPEDGQRTAAPALPRLTIPSLQELLVALGHRVGFILHLRETTPPLPAAVAHLCDDFDLYRQAVIACQTLTAVGQLRALNPRLPLALALGPHPAIADLAAARDAGCRLVLLDAFTATAELATAAGICGLLAHVGPVNSPATCRRVLGAGFRAITTDAPEALAPVLEERQG